VAADDVELDDALLTLVIAAGLPRQEPIMQWLREEREGVEHRDDLTLRAGDLALVMADGLLEYRVCSETGAVLVSDHRDPRAMRSQRYERGRPQPYLPPHVEDRRPEW
jgi:hypothetical protein